MPESRFAAPMDPAAEPTPQDGARSSQSAAETSRLRPGTLTTPNIVAMVIAAAAPIAGVVGLVPLSIALGGGVATPGVLALVVLVLALFAVGFTRIIPHVRNAGAFYAYVTQGLGRPIGLVAAYVAPLCYLALGASTLGGFGFFASDGLSRLAGIHVPWPVCAIFVALLAAVLGYYRVAVAARVLMVVLGIEVLLLFVLDLAILIGAGLPAFSLEAFSPHAVFGGGTIGVAVLYAMSCFLGFEGTAIYSEEARNPLRTIPRATFLVILVAGLFYSLSAWAMLAGAGFSQAVVVAAESPGTFVFGLSDQYVGRLWTALLSILVVTSLFAGVLAFHNAASRYFFALARDGVLPRALARVSLRYGTPAVAGGAVLLVFLATILAFALAGLDPLLNLSTSMAGLGTIGLMSLLTLVSLAIAGYFWRQGRIGLATIAAPLASAVLIGTGTFFGVRNFDALTGSTSPLINSLPWIHVGVAAIALVAAFVLRQTRPAAYAGLGRTRVE